ncbi:MAG: tyrosine--tRNA ligase [Rhizobiales bacterium]|nr:tyrosine--tRNA ligase [Hyphomicrobiales bacterium]
MTIYKSDFLAILNERGFIHQCSNAEGLDAQLCRETTTAYVGFDCTADSLHVGNLISIMMLHWFQAAGHRPIALMGGGTTRVGDPSGKDESRQLLTPELIESNKQGIKQAFDRLLGFGEGPHDAVMADNADWLLDLHYIDFLRDIGRHLSVNQMLQRDSVRLRLDREQHLSFLEFNYMCLQAYDFVELNRRYGCLLQMGGSDQWGNILSGVDLGRRVANTELFALTTPLLTTASGAKMGKTAEGAVWLNESRLSAYDYWQFWRNTEDADVERFLMRFTVLSMDEIRRLGALQGAEINEAKKILAHEATRLMRGEEAAIRARETAEKTFEQSAIAEDLPTIEVPLGDLKAGIGLLGLYVDAGLCASNGESRRQVKGGAVRINDHTISDERRLLTDRDLADGVIKLSLGKKKHVLVRPV